MKKVKYAAPILLLALLTTGISLAQAEKNKLSLGLGYYNENNRMQYLKATTKTKIEGKFTPAGGIRVRFYIGSEGPGNLLGAATTDDKGQGILYIPPNARAEWDKSPQQSFVAVTDSSQLYDAVTTSADLIKARIKLDTANDRKVIATLIEQKGSAWRPVGGVDMKIAVHRMGGDLNINEDPLFTTDSQGIVSADFKLLNLPGDSLGNLILVARIDDNDSYGSIITEKSVPWGTPTTYISGFNERSLFARRGRSPVWLEWIAYGIILGVWSVLFYLFFQIRKLKKLGV